MNDFGVAIRRLGRGRLRFDLDGAVEIWFQLQKNRYLWAPSDRAVDVGGTHRLDQIFVVTINRGRYKNTTTESCKRANTRNLLDE